MFVGLRSYYIKILYQEKCRGGDLNSYELTLTTPSRWRVYLFHHLGMAGVAGFEPTTNGFGDRRSTWLSYTPVSTRANLLSVAISQTPIYEHILSEIGAKVNLALYAGYVAARSDLYWVGCLIVGIISKQVMEKRHWRLNMEVYLVQHGEAKPESEDPERPLTDKGRAEVESVARYVAGLGIEVSRILHSGRLRTKQTAEILAQHLVPPQGVLEQGGLGPLDDPQEAKRLVEQAEKPLMLVGHLPHLSRLTALLILGDPEKEVVRFNKGGVVYLGRSDEGWSIGWALVPRLVRQMGEPGKYVT